MGNSEVDVRRLAIQLLSSPQNLDFALAHQIKKVEEFQEKIGRLLTNLVKSEEEKMAPEKQSLKVQMVNKPVFNKTTRHIELPSTFKYPEPIDVHPVGVVNGVQIYAEHVDSSCSSPEVLNPARLAQPAYPTHLTNPTLSSINYTRPTIVLPEPNIAYSENMSPLNLQNPNVSYLPSSFHQTLPNRGPGNRIPSPGNRIPSPSNRIPSPDSRLTPPFSHIPLSPPILSTSPPKKPMLELVVGDLTGFDPDMLNTTLWDQSKVAFPVQDTGVVRRKRKSSATAPQERIPLEAFQGPNPILNCKNSGPCGVTRGPFIHWKHAVECSLRSRRGRTKIEPHMLHFLENKYNISHFVTAFERKCLADRLCITERAVIYWFQNRRRKDIKNLNNTADNE